VFENNPVPWRVNSQLWTVPYELYCYIALSLLAVIGVVKRPALVVLAAVGLTALNFGHDLMSNMDTLKAGGTANIGGINLVISFLFGVALFLYRERIPWSGRLFWASAVAMVALLCSPFGEPFSLLPAAYCTIYLGLQDPRKLFLLRGADYSYGLYLYGLVVSQALAAVGVREWWSLTILTVACAGVFAAFSWRFVEKPAMGLRPKVKALEERWLSVRAAWAPKSAVVADDLG
jgi:peptidoglycan/LPS O-acetylase OafA/YrhL